MSSLSHKRTSQIWLIPKDILQEYINMSGSKREILEKIGYTNNCGNTNTLNNRIREENLDLSLYSNNRKIKQASGLSSHIKRTKLSNDNLFVINCPHCRNIVKSRIIKEKIFPYECYKCKNTGQWQGEKLSLQLDHVNGIPNDNRLENLRFSCPNCHSQTSTFGRKAREPRKCKKCKCGNDIQKRYGKWCENCRPKSSFMGKEKIIWPSNDELKRLVWEKPLNSLGKELGVTGTSIKVRCQRFEIELPRQGYWIRIYNGHSPEEARNKLPEKIRKHKHLDKNQILDIKILRKSGMKLREIGRIFKVDHTTIARALRNN